VRSVVLFHLFVVLWYVMFGKLSEFDHLCLWLGLVVTVCDVYKHLSTGVDCALIRNLATKYTTYKGVITQQNEKSHKRLYTFALCTVLVGASNYKFKYHIITDTTHYHKTYRIITHYYYYLYTQRLSSSRLQFLGRQLALHRPPNTHVVISCVNKFKL
jgi:hypothetical protein